MKSEDAKKFKELLVQMSEVFDDGKKISELKTVIYFDILANYKIEKIELAVKTLFKSRIYPGFPKPAEIIQLLDGTNNDIYKQQLAENEQWLKEKDKEFERLSSQNK